MEQIPEYKTAKSYYRNPRKTTKERLDKLDSRMVKYGDLGGIVHNRRSNQIIGGNQRTKVILARPHTIEIARVFDAPDAQGTVAEGFVVYESKTGVKTRMSYRVVDWDAETESAANVIANTDAGMTDWDIIASDWKPSELALADFDIDLLNSLSEDALNLRKMIMANEKTPDFQPVGIDEQGRLDQKKPVICPECGHEFSPK